MSLGVRHAPQQPGPTLCRRALTIQPTRRRWLKTTKIQTALSLLWFAAWGGLNEHTSLRRLLAVAYFAIETSVRISATLRT
jgi:hypothetical protein